MHLSGPRGQFVLPFNLSMTCIPARTASVRVWQLVCMADAIFEPSGRTCASLPSITGTSEDSSPPADAPCRFIRPTPQRRNVKHKSKHTSHFCLLNVTFSEQMIHQKIRTLPKRRVFCAVSEASFQKKPSKESEVRTHSHSGHFVWLECFSAEPVYLEPLSIFMSVTNNSGCSARSLRRPEAIKQVGRSRACEILIRTA